MQSIFVRNLEKDNENAPYAYFYVKNKLLVENTVLEAPGTIAHYSKRFRYVRSSKVTSSKIIHAQRKPPSSVTRKEALPLGRTSAAYVSSHIKPLIVYFAR